MAEEISRIDELFEDAAVDDAPVVQPQVVEEEADTASGSGRRVLIADDSMAVRYQISEIIKAIGHEVLEAADGVEALELVRDPGADLILLDLVMPKKDGVEFLRDLRADDSLKDTPVILLTGFADPQLVRKVAELQVKDYLVKPPDQYELIRRVRKYLSR